MNRVARFLAGALLAGAVLVGAVVLPAGPAAECTCAGVGAELADDSDLVFTGVVRDSRSDGSVQTVVVDRALKGAVTRKVDVVIPSEDSCSLDWELGDRVLVFGDLQEGELTSGPCRSAVSTDRGFARVVDGLGAGAEPRPGYLRAEQAGLTYDQWRVGRLVMGVVGLAFLALGVVRILRARRAGRRAPDGG